MITKQFKKEDDAPVAKLIREGGMVAIPTDTVYGLAIRSGSADLYQTLKETKGRPDSKPFPLMVASLEQLKDLVEMDGRIEHLVKTFMPGAVTFIFEKQADVFPFLGTQATLGIRMADDPWVQSVILKVGAPIWLPSANLSGEPTGTTSDEVLAQLDAKIHGVVLGSSQKKQSSSVFDITRETIQELRAGAISLEEIQEVQRIYLEKNR